MPATLPCAQSETPCLPDPGQARELPAVEPYVRDFMPAAKAKVSRLAGGVRQATSGCRDGQFTKSWERRLAGETIR